MGIGVGRTFFVLLLVLAVRSAAAARSSPVAVAGEKAGQQGRYSVLDFHAAGDGKTDDAPAFLEAWQAACSDGSSPILVIPGGRTFLLSKIRFQGSCKSPITVQLDGNIVAPNYIWTAESDNLLTFYRIDNLTVAGNGQIDGRGAIWWSCYNHKRCTHRPNDGGVAITDARFINIHGTSSEKQAIQILCSQSVPCRGIYLHDVTLYWNKKNHVSQAQSRILNAHGTIVGNVVPEVQFITAQ